MQNHCWGDQEKTNWLGHVLGMATKLNSRSCPTLNTTWQEKKKEIKSNIEEDGNIRAGGNAGSVHCKGQRKMAANCRCPMSHRGRK